MIHKYKKDNNLHYWWNKNEVMSATCISMLLFYYSPNVVVKTLFFCHEKSKECIIVF